MDIKRITQSRERFNRDELTPELVGSVIHQFYYKKQQTVSDFDEYPNMDNTLYSDVEGERRYYYFLNTNGQRCRISPYDAITITKDI